MNVERRRGFVSFNGRGLGKQSAGTGQIPIDRGFLAHSIVFGPARVKENCLSLSFVVLLTYQTWRRESKDAYRRVAGRCSPSERRLAWGTALADGAGKNCAAAKPARPDPRGKSPAPGKAPPRWAGRFSP